MGGICMYVLAVDKKVQGGFTTDCVCVAWLRPDDNIRRLHAYLPTVSAERSAPSLMIMRA
jgi:hypothetical protein